jgi:Carbamoyl-phosphate synthetase large chain, oligomerisation domain.
VDNRPGGKIKNSTIDDLDKDWLRMLKKKGFSDKGMADMLKISPDEIYKLRIIWNIRPAYKMVDTCGGEFEALSPYYYSTYEEHDEVNVSENKK